MAAFSIIAIIGTANSVQVQAYTSDELTTATSQGYNIAKNARIGTFAMETCTNQLAMKDMSNIDACMSFMGIFDKYMSMAVSEANSDIQKITGYGIN